MQKSITDIIIGAVMFINLLFAIIAYFGKDFVSANLPDPILPWPAYIVIMMLWLLFAFSSNIVHFVKSRLNANSEIVLEPKVINETEIRCLVQMTIISMGLNEIPKTISNVRDYFFRDNSHLNIVILKEDLEKIIPEEIKRLS